MDNSLPLDDNQKVQQKPEPERSKKNPGISLEETLRNVTEIKARVGKKGISNAMLENEFGVPPIAKGGRFATIMSAARQYGLIEGGRNSMSLTELALSIIDAVHDDERKTGIRQAFLNPPIYKDIIKEFGGELLPTGLPNILARRFGISDSFKERAAGLFVESATFAGLLGNDRMLTSMSNRMPDESTLNANEGDLVQEELEVSESSLQRLQPPPQEGTTMIPGFTSATHQTVSIALTGDKRGFSAVPFDATREDIDIMKAMLDVMLMRLKTDRSDALAA